MVLGSMYHDGLAEQQRVSRIQWSCGIQTMPGVGRVLLKSVTGPRRYVVTRYAPSVGGDGYGAALWWAGEAARFSTWDRNSECSSDSMKESTQTQIAGKSRW